MNHSRRHRELAREFKERKSRPGVFAVRCRATGAVWVGAAKNLDTQKNGTWFQLKMGSHTNAALQESWNRDGADAFTFEELEEIDADNSEMIPLLLKERAAHWREKLAADKVAG